MIEYLGEQQILHVHRSLLAATGGAGGLRDRGMLQSALARPAASFAGQDLYVSLSEKAAALMHSLVSTQGHSVAPETMKTIRIWFACRAWFAD